MVECQLPKLKVASSILVARSKFPQPKQTRTFYSWQYDTPRKDNRYFIEEALKRVIRALNKDDSIIGELIINRDTKGVPGAPFNC